MSEMRERIVAETEAHTGRVAAPDDRLDALGVDSVAMADLLARLERRLGFHADADILEAETVADLADYIEVRQR